MGKGAAKTRKLTSRSMKGPGHLLSGDWECQQAGKALQKHAFSKILMEKRKSQTSVPAELNTSDNQTRDILTAENNRITQMAMLDEGGVGSLAGVDEDEDADEEWENEDAQENDPVVDLFHYTHEFITKLEYRDHRTRREKVELDQARWEPQLEGMVDGFMDWEFRYEGRLPSEWDSYLIETPKYVDFDGAISFLPFIINPPELGFIP
ncbi:hypothetical protein V5O48_008969 [Marasmius crinis-equi]|uniref:Uncharacterized protein n=1 Tax=Marasmius crinis-equi TaxID=585013 RepID=A0ABR3FCI2_9AGAR